jgi:hypothetical protein
MAADISDPKTKYAKIQREAAERIVDDDRARWVSPDAIQRTEPIPGMLLSQPTITDSECEINAGAYAGRGRGASERLLPSHTEEVRRKVAVWPEIYDHKAPLPSHYPRCNCTKTVRGVTLMSRAELERLSEMPITFSGSGAPTVDDLIHKSGERLARIDFVQQHYVDDERESSLAGPKADIPVDFHEIDGTESET